MPQIDPATDLFLTLTPDKVLEAVESAGLRTNPVCYPLNSFENRVYEVELYDQTRIIAKFYRPGRWSEEQILEEHDFIIDLVEDELAVCPVRPFPDGSTLQRKDHILYTLADRRGGRAPDELDHEGMARLGMLVGRMHATAVTRDAPNRLTLDADTFIRANLTWLQDNDTLPARLAGRYVETASEIAEVLDERMRGVPLHRVHGDLHLGNLLFREGVLNLLDFDDMATGPAVQDLWLALPGRDPWALQLRESLIEGYERFRTFDRATLNLIEPLRAARMVHYATWLARRWHDPVFPRTWPHFGDPGYWDDATADLEEQLRAIRTESDPTPPQEEEPDLTDSDFFWDM